MLKINLKKININIINSSGHQNPKLETLVSAGADLRAFIDESITLKPFERRLIPTGIKVAIPVDLEIQIRPRSGLAAKESIGVLNSPGTIDSDYRGEIKIILFNHGSKDFIINNGDRVAQMVLVPILKMELEEVDNLPDTLRGEGGFGSTGKNEF